MPRTGGGRNTRRVTPTDTGESSNQSPLTLELSSLTVAVLKMRLRERNLPTNRKKVTLIHRLIQQPPQHLIQLSPSNNSATARAEPAPLQERSNSTAPHHETNSEDNASGETQHTTAINSSIIPASLLVWHS